MRLLFKIPKEKDIIKQLTDIAEHYGSKVNKEDIGKGHFILVQPKLQITHQPNDNYEIIKVWGASEQDFDYLKEIFGEPEEILKEKPSPKEFAEELVRYSNNVQKPTKKQIIEIFDLTERDYKQYHHTLRLLSRRSSTEENIKLALEILEQAKNEEE